MLCGLEICIFISYKNLVMLSTDKLEHHLFLIQ